MPRRPCSPNTSGAPARRRTSRACARGPNRTSAAAFDFLFTYYPHRPTRLERWHPSPDVLLTGEQADRFLARPGYCQVDGGVLLDSSALTERIIHTAQFALPLLRSAASARLRLSCFGLHEWAMVCRLPAHEVRHSQVPLRLGGAGTDDVVDTLGVRCGHYDGRRSRGIRARKPRSPATQRLCAPG